MRKIINLLLISSLFLASCKDNHDSSEPIPPPESTDKMNWWEEARFGMFIHWGLYSVWEGKYNGLDVNGNNIDIEMCRDGNGAGTEWMQRVARIPTDTYLSRLSEFNSSQFDTDHIAQLAKNAGMKYIVITSKHHEGVCLWDSKHDPINIAQSGAGVDVLKKLKQSCDKYGLKFGVYFSQNYDWSISGGFGQDYYKQYTKEQHEEYIDKYVLPVLGELFDNLDPDILWWDIPTGNPYPELAEKINTYVKTHGNARLITNDRLSQLHKGDFGTGENDFFHGDGYGENCIRLNRTWGYGSSFEKEELYQRLAEIIFTNIVGSVSRGQNVLINIGPKGDGSIPALQINRLQGIANWMDKNSRAVIGCTRALKVSNPQWGRITMNKKTNQLFLVIQARSSEIYLDGIDTQNLNNITTIENAAVDYQIISTDRIRITGYKPVSDDNIPVVLVADYKGDIIINDYTYVDNSMSALAFWGDGLIYKVIRMDDDAEPYLVAWWSEGIQSKIKFNGESGKYKVRVVFEGYQWKTNPIFTLTIGKQNATKTISENSSFMDGTFDLEKGKLYDISLNKDDAQQSWANFKKIEFIKAD